MSNRHFFHFTALPLSMRMVYTMTLLVLGTGYLFAMLQVYFSHAGLDGNANNISAEDIRTAYHGSESDTPGAQTDSLPTDRRLTSSLVWAGQARPRVNIWREKETEGDEDSKNGPDDA